MSLWANGADWLGIFTHFFSLSLFSVGGVTVAVPEMHRFLVDERHWLTVPQFANSIALAQSAPGPNVLFVALLGWNVGVNAVGGMDGTQSSWLAPVAGLVLALTGILAPSTTLAYFAGRWLDLNRRRRAVRAFRNGMAPIVIALVLATGWLVTGLNTRPGNHWPFYLLTLVSALLVWRTRVHLLWLIAAGAGLGAFGLV